MMMDYTRIILFLQVIEAKWWHLSGKTYGNNIDYKEESETFLTWFWAILGLIGGLVVLWRCFSFCYTLCIDNFEDLEENSAGRKSEKRESFGNHTALPQMSVE